MLIYQRVIDNVCVYICVCVWVQFIQEAGEGEYWPV